MKWSTCKSAHPSLIQIFKDLLCVMLGDKAVNQTYSPLFGQNLVSYGSQLFQLNERSHYILRLTTL
jgi:hypothetical protein